MCELVLLVSPILQRDEDAQVVRSRYNAHACTGELCTQLIIPFRADALLGTIDVEGGHGRVVGSLLGEVGNCDCLAVASNAVGAARWSRGRCLQDRVCVFDFPVTLGKLVCHA